MDTSLSPLSDQATVPADAWRVVCLCAAWCGVCRDYQAAFQALAIDHQGIQFEWIDVEEDEELVGDVDVETFPTVLVAQGARARFFGPLLPHAGVLGRLLKSLAEEGGASRGADPVAQALLQRLLSQPGR